MNVSGMGSTLTDLPEFSAEDIENSELEIIEHPEAATERSAGRRLALQVLYEIDLTNHPFVDVLNYRLQEKPASRKAERYVRQLVKGVVEYKSKLDALIQQYASEWPLDQVATVDRNILRLAVFEFASQPNMSDSVVIAEAIELASLFGADGSTRFVNGVLGAVATSERESLRQIVPPQPEDGE